MIIVINQFTTSLMCKGKQIIKEKRHRRGRISVHQPMAPPARLINVPEKYVNALVTYRISCG